MVTFHATLQLHGKTATGIEVPADVVAALGAGKRPPVVVTLNGYSYRSTVAPMGGRHLLPVSAENRAGAGIAAGDEVEVTLEPDDTPRTVVVPDDLAAALAAHPPAAERFAALSFSHQREHVTAVESAKAEATRQRRIDKVVATLTGA